MDCVTRLRHDITKITPRKSCPTHLGKPCRFAQPTLQSGKRMGCFNGLACKFCCRATAALGLPYTHRSSESLLLRKARAGAELAGKHRHLLAPGGCVRVIGEWRSDSPDRVSGSKKIKIAKLEAERTVRRERLQSRLISSGFSLSFQLQDARS